MSNSNRSHRKNRWYKKFNDGKITRERLEELKKNDWRAYNGYE